MDSQRSGSSSDTSLDPQRTELLARELSNAKDSFLRQDGPHPWVDHWSIREYFEPQIGDRWNFGLDENWVSLITAFATGFSMLLVADITFRLVVRMKTGEVSKFTVYKYYLIRVFSNPLSLLSWFLRWLQLRKLISQSDNTHDVQRRAHNRKYSSLKTWSIRLIGICLVLVEVGFIFLATNRNTAERIDASLIPSFEIEDRSVFEFYPFPVAGCTVAPITSKPGFKSNGNLFVCNSIDLYSECVLDGPLDVYATVRVRWNVHVYINVKYKNVEWILQQYTGISIANGTVYKSMHRFSPREVTQKLTTIFENRNFSVVDNETIDTNDMQRSEVMVYVGVTNLTTTDVMIRLGAIVRGSMFPTGRSNGIVLHAAGNHRLEEVTDTFVINQRPWLGVIPSLILCAGLFAVSVLLTLLGWEGDIDDRWAWKELFFDTITINDFNKGNDEKINLQWAANIDGKAELKYLSRADQSTQ